MARSTPHRPSAILGGLACAGLLFAQAMIVGGNALDRNLMVGSGGMNARTARNVMPLQRSIYSVQDGRMQYNEAAAFAQPRYVPIGREGQVQATGMIYASRSPNVPHLATPTSMARPRGVYDDVLPSRAPQFEGNSLAPPRYAPMPAPSAGMSTYRAPAPTGDPTHASVGVAPAYGYATPAAVRSSVAARDAALPTITPGEGVQSEKYRVSGVSYGWR